MKVQEVSRIRYFIARLFPNYKHKKQKLSITHNKSFYYVILKTKKNILFFKTFKKGNVLMMKKHPLCNITYLTTDKDLATLLSNQDGVKVKEQKAFESVPLHYVVTGNIPSFFLPKKKGRPSKEESE